jgi:hypothetical protein
MKGLICFILMLIPWLGSTQVAADSLSTNSRYFEDQFYLGISYNFLFKKEPSSDEGANLSQRKLSYGLQAGFIKDIPLNGEGTFALGIGLGGALNTYYSNLKAIEMGNEITYNIDANDIRRSKLETNLVEVPIQFRWRNSTSSEYKFWRLYAGFKFGYALGTRSKFVSRGGGNETQSKITFNNTDIRRFQYGITLDFGYSSFNVHIHYSLTDLLNDNVRLESGEQIQMQPLRIGLIFYIL